MGLFIKYKLVKGFPDDSTTSGFMDKDTHVKCVIRRTPYFVQYKGREYYAFERRELLKAEGFNKQQEDLIRNMYALDMTAIKNSLRDSRGKCICIYGTVNDPTALLEAVRRKKFRIVAKSQSKNHKMRIAYKRKTIEDSEMDKVEKYQKLEGLNREPAGDSIISMYMPEDKAVSHMIFKGTVVETGVSFKYRIYDKKLQKEVLSRMQELGYETDVDKKEVKSKKKEVKSKKQEKTPKKK